MAWAQRLCPARFSFGVLGTASLSYIGRPAYCEQDFTSKPGLEFGKLTRISYTSTMKGNVTTAGLALERLSGEFGWRGARDQISGVMCYDAPNKQVFQVLEGSPEHVALLWERISKDARHVIDHDSVSFEAVDSRKYPEGWGMRYSRFDQLKNGLLESDTTTGDLVQVMCKSCLKRQNGVEGKIMEELMQKATAENSKLDITGWVMYNDRTQTVYQVLEGSPAVVEKVMDTILQDPRHEVCLGSVKRKAIEQREFPNWSNFVDRSVGWRSCL